MHAVCISVSFCLFFNILALLSKREFNISSLFLLLTKCKSVFSCSPYCLSKSIVSHVFTNYSNFLYGNVFSLIPSYKNLCTFSLFYVISSLLFNYFSLYISKVSSSTKLSGYLSMLSFSLLFSPKVVVICSLLFSDSLVCLLFSSSLKLDLSVIFYSPNVVVISS